VTINGRSNWQRLHCLWDLQTFFFNLYTCSAGSQVSGTLGVSPPTVHKYLYSINNNLLIDIPGEEFKEEFDGDELTNIICNSNSNSSLIRVACYSVITF
jgi:hypothetical protein